MSDTPKTNFEPGGVFARPQPQIADPHLAVAELPDMGPTSESLRRGGYSLSEGDYRDRPGEIVGYSHTEDN